MIYEPSNPAISCQKQTISEISCRFETRTHTTHPSHVVDNRNVQKKKPARTPGPCTVLDSNSVE